MSIAAAAGEGKADKYHECAKCGNGPFKCDSPNTCDFNREVPDCPKCFRLFDAEKTFIQQHPYSKYNPENLVKLMNGSTKPNPTTCIKCGNQMQNVSMAGLPEKLACSKCGHVEGDPSE